MNTEGDEEKVKFYSEEHKFSCFIISPTFVPKFVFEKINVKKIILA